MPEAAGEEPGTHKWTSSAYNIENNAGAMQKMFAKRAAGLYNN